MPKRPMNLLFLWTDEHRADVMGCYGDKLVRTPNLDRLAPTGTLFDRAYCCQPVCTPSRGCIMTGQWPHKHGAQTNNIPLNPDCKTLAELVDPGYRRGYHGKWHLGNEITAQHGWEEWVSIDDGMYRDFYSDPKMLEERSSYHHFLWDHGFSPGSEKHRGTPLYSRDFAAAMPYRFSKAGFLAQTASGFLNSQPVDKPFVLSVNFLEPHMPFFGPFNDRYRPEELEVGPAFAAPPAPEASLRNRVVSAKYRHKGFANRPLKTEWDWRRYRANYYGLVEMVDTAMGQILDTLEKTGLADNTVVVYTSDHGEMMGDHAMLAKTVMYEESLRIPLIIRTPGQKQGLRVTGPVSQIDLVPTVLDLIDQPIPEGLPGQSLAKLVKEGGASTRDAFAMWHGSDASPAANADIPGFTPEELEQVRHQDWRTVVSLEGWKLNLCKTDPCPELYSLNDDPHEMTNRYNDPTARGIRDELTARIAAWEAKALV